MYCFGLFWLFWIYRDFSQRENKQGCKSSKLYVAQNFPHYSLVYISNVLYISKVESFDFIEKNHTSLYLWMAAQNVPGEQQIFPFRVSIFAISSLNYNTGVVV